MANLASVSDNYFTVASETFTDNLSSSIAAGAATVPVNNASEYAEGDCVVLTVDPGTANEATFIGKKDSGNQFIECVWTEGNTAVGHDAGATIIDYDSATHHYAQSKGIKQFANDDGSLKADPIRTALGLSAASTNGWEVFPYTFTVASGYNKSNRSFELTVANQDVTSLLSPGMRLRLERNTAAPTQCADLELSSSQYASKSSPSGITFTDDWTAEAWVKPESNGTVMHIINMLNGTTSGWAMRLSSNGQLEGVSQRIAANNRVITSYQSLVLGKWQHVAVTMDNSANTHTMYINGVSIAFATTTTGTITALVQASVDLRLGALASSASLYFDGKIADVRVWSAVRTETEIRDNMNQLLTGSESNLVAYYKLNGDFNDSTSNANNLTASGSAVATDTDNPFSTTQYAIITDVSYSAPNSTVTVFTGTDHNIPNMTLNSPFYSTQSVPFGFPKAQEKWQVIALYAGDRSTTSSSFATMTDTISVPIGAWSLKYKIAALSFITGTSASQGVYTLSSDASTETHSDLTSFNDSRDASAAAQSRSGSTATPSTLLSLSSATTFTMLAKNSGGAGTTQILGGSVTPSVYRAICAYL